MKILQIIASLAFIFVSSTPSFAQQALVRSYADPAQPIGQAFLTHYTDHCLALLPTHVAKESKIPTFLHEGNSLIGETSRTIDLGEDLSLAIVNGNLSKDCGYSMSTVSRAVERLIQGHGVATLRSINGDGSIARLAVAIIDDDGSRFLHVRPTNDKIQIRKGHSGSLLMINDQPIGMLLSVNARHGVGRILRIDALLSMAEKYMLDNRLPAQENKEAAQLQNSENNDLAAAANGGNMTGWNVLPIDAEHRASNLIAANNALGWRAKVDQWPVEIELDLAGGKVALLKIELDGNDIAKEELPQQVEIFVNVSKNKKRWRSLLNKKVNFDAQAIASISFAPTWARQIKIVIRNNNSYNKMIGLRRLHAYGS